MDDALAAGELFSYLKEKYPITVEEIHKYSLEQRMLEKIDERLISNLHNLSGIIQGIIEGIVCNDTIEEKKIIKLKDWLVEHDYLTGEFMSAPRNAISKKLKEKGAIEKGGTVQIVSEADMERVLL